MGLVYSNNNVYYYRSYREGTKVKHQYLGHGELALAVARAIQHERDRGRAAREAGERSWQCEVKRFEALDMQIIKYESMIKDIVEWTLINLGFYQHARTWRPRPMTTERRAELKKKVQSFWDRVAAGDVSTLDELKRHFDVCPEKFVQLFGGDLDGRVVELIIDRVAGKDLAQREAIRRNVEKYRADLAGVFPSSLESVLVERCALLNLAVLEAELFSYRNMDSMSTKRADFHERRRDRAHRRYISALKTLTMVREKSALVEERRKNARRGKIPRFRVGSGSDRMASVN